LAEPFKSHAMAGICPSAINEANLLRESPHPHELPQCIPPNLMKKLCPGWPGMKSAVKTGNIIHTQSPSHWTNAPDYCDIQNYHQSEEPQVITLAILPRYMFAVFLSAPLWGPTCLLFLFIPLGTMGSLVLSLLWVFISKLAASWANSSQIRFMMVSALRAQ